MHWTTPVHNEKNINADTIVRLGQAQAQAQSQA